MTRSLDEFWKEEDELRRAAIQHLDPKAGGTDRKTDRLTRKNDGFIRRMGRKSSIAEQGERIERRKA